MAVLKLAVGALAALVVLLAAAEAVPAQMVSPGKLSTAHAGLEGVRGCTQCHQLKQRGSSPKLCLSCHEALAGRLAQRKGYHATVAERSCGECHKEHLGRDFDVLRLDSARFAHDDTGYELRGKHLTAGCRGCHAPEKVRAPGVRGHKGGAAFLRRTFLGLARNCTACHNDDDPHDKQFAGEECSSCHVEEKWESVPRFEHGRSAYRLTGAHTTVECAGCHKSAEQGETVRWRGLTFASCADCHRDPHANRMGASCTRCHTTADWSRITADLSKGFDHKRTGFVLRGAHEQAECATCHARPRPNTGIALRFVVGSADATYPRPVVKDCGSCHIDPHPRAVAVASSTSCAGCHSEQAWTPVRYGPEKHGRTFPLDGAHLVATCVSCHRAEPAKARFTLPAVSTCRSCHKADDPHKDRFGAVACEECHSTKEWQAARFEHKRFSAQSCVSCHSENDPHNGQFKAVGCETCHTTNTFRLASFDHKGTRFPLDGAHQKVECGSCHPVERDGRSRTFVRYKPLQTTCRSCHGSDS